jgi:hypothetical protein
MLAIKACVDSYWKDSSTPESAEALLGAGASVVGVKYPCGHSRIDALLATRM